MSSSRGPMWSLPIPAQILFLYRCFKYFIYLLLERGEGKERGRETWMCKRYIDWFTSQLGTWPTTQASALTGNPTSNTLLRRTALNPLSHINQGIFFLFFNPTINLLYSKLVPVFFPLLFFVKSLFDLMGRFYGFLFHFLDARPFFSPESLTEMLDLTARPQNRYSVF